MNEVQTPAVSPGTGERVPVHAAPPPIVPEKTLSPAQWGMLSFLASEVAFFGTLIVAYVVFMGQDQSPEGVGGPKPGAVLQLSALVIVSTLCLFSSSGTIHLAESSLHRGNEGGFRLWWGLTILLGVIFLAGTAIEWRELIYEHHLTISRNLFGTSYYTLVGFHAAHVTGGVVAMSIVLGLALRRQVTARNQTGVQMVAWYWHFVDIVWVAVFTVVYLGALMERLRD